MKFYLLLLMASTPAWARPIHFKVYDVNGTSQANLQRVTEGIQQFTRLLAEHCSIAIEPQISHRALALPNMRFRYEDWWQAYPLTSGENFYFRYYQRSLYEVTSALRLRQEDQEVSLFVANELPLHCADATPMIQFNDAEARARRENRALYSRVIPWLRNRIVLTVLSSNRADCANYSRLVAHELAHIFVQDDPAHSCAVAGGRQAPCAPDNLLASYIRARTPPVHRGGAPDGGDSASEAIRRMASGTKLSPLQCERIRHSLDTIWRR